MLAAAALAAASCVRAAKSACCWSAAGAGAAQYVSVSPTCPLNQLGTQCVVAAGPLQKLLKFTGITRVKSAVHAVDARTYCLTTGAKCVCACCPQFACMHTVYMHTYPCSCTLHTLMMVGPFSSSLRVSVLLLPVDCLLLAATDTTLRRGSRVEPAGLP
jgi:hypothetical protein